MKLSLASVRRSTGFLALVFFVSLTLGACSDNNGESLIGPGGGTIQAAGVTIVIPPGALDSFQEISISIATDSDYPADNDIIGTPVKIEPDLVFLKPVTITMPYTLPQGVLELNTALATLQAGAWTPIPESVVDIANKTVSASVMYLSLYTPFWYEPPIQMIKGYYLNAYFKNKPDFALAHMDNTFYNDDGKTASYGPEDSDQETWNPFSYTIRADGLLKSRSTLPDRNTEQGFGFIHPESKVNTYMQTSHVNTCSSFLFGFQKPDADYLPSMVGSQYFVGGYHSSPTDSQRNIFADRINFETTEAGRIISQEGDELPFTYIVESGGKVTMTANYPDGKRVLTGHLSSDACFLICAYENPDYDTVGVTIGVRLSTGKTNADLSGNYHTTLYQPEMSDTRVLYRSMTFDGQGGGTYTTYDEALEEETATGTLTYEVNDDGTFTLNLLKLSEGQNETSALSADNNVFVNPDHYGTHHTYTFGVKKLD